MNNIKIILAESGRIADLKKDFPLYQGAFQNKLLNVMVPTSIIAPQFTSQAGGVVTADYVASTSLKIGMQYTARDGSIKTSTSYYMRYLKKFMYQNVEYALYERKLPKEFTLYAGQGANAPILIANVVNIQNAEISTVIADEPSFTAVNIEQAVWENKVTASGIYTFTYSNTTQSWSLNGATVNLSNYGISVIGTVTNGSFTVSYTQSKILSITPSQTCSLDVLPSTDLDTDETIEPSELEVINGQINSINEILAQKQDKTDLALNTTNKTVVGGINELVAKDLEQDSNIQENTQDISELSQRVADIESSYTGVEEYIGQLTGSSLPTNEELTQFVQANTNPSRLPKNADVVIFILQIPDETDKNYKYIYSTSGWKGYEIPALETAKNGSLGIIEGTYNIGSANNTLVDIVGGQIVNIYVKDITDTYRNIREYANTLNTTVNNVISGDITVGLALKAVQDSLGNDISNTYLTQNAGATKQYVHDYALPREFNDVSFLTNVSTAGLGIIYNNTIPTEPASGIQTSLTTNGVGDFTVFNASKFVGAYYELSSKNSSQNSIYISASADCTVQFRMTTVLHRDAMPDKDLSVELTSPIALTANEITKINFGNQFTLLVDEVVNIDSLLSYFVQTLEVFTTVSTPITFNVYSNETYPSTFWLNTHSYSVITGQGMLGEQPSYSLQGVEENGILTFYLPDNTALNNNTECEFVLNYNLDLPLTVQVQLKSADQVIRLVTPYNFESGLCTLADLQQTNIVSNSANGTVYTFKGFVKVSGGDEISVIVDEDNLSQYASKQYTDQQDIAFIGREQQVDFNATLENNQIIATLDESVADFEFTSSTAYLFHIYLPLVTTTGDLDNSYPIYLRDKDGNDIYINTIFQKELSRTSTVGDMCQLQDYDIGVGYSWEFNGHYREVNNAGNLVRTVYTADISRETNPSMTGQELHSAVLNGKLKAGTTVFVTQNYSINGHSYVSGATYLITSENVGGELVLDAVEYMTYVKFTDYSNSATGEAGVVTTNPNYGISTQANGLLTIQSATSDAIDNKENMYNPIVSMNLDYATMKALTDPKNHAWTEEQQQLAKTTLGVKGTTTIIRRWS